MESKKLNLVIEHRNWSSESKSRTESRLLIMQIPNDANELFAKTEILQHIFIQFPPHFEHTQPTFVAKTPARLIDRNFSRSIRTPSLQLCFAKQKRQLRIEPINNENDDVLIRTRPVNIEKCHESKARLFHRFRAAEFDRFSRYFFVSYFYGSIYVFFSIFLPGGDPAKTLVVRMKGNQTLFRSRSDCIHFRYMLRKPDGLTLKLVFHSKVYNGKKLIRNCWSII